MADDDAEDCQLVRDALMESGSEHELRCVRDGVELFDYLRRAGEYANGRPAPRPDIILLDFKMPRMDGREALAEIKSDPQFRQIPVVALTTSAAEDDIGFSYDLGVNSFVSKPTSFRQWVEILRILSDYWFRVVELPPPPSRKKGIGDRIMMKDEG
ncbi:MAG: response regulator [Pirellulales bacterium]|nr:response regulator [Pirellulales bacterium]